MRTMFGLWIKGNSAERIVPYRNLRPNDLCPTETGTDVKMLIKYPESGE